MNINQLTHSIIGCCIEVHRELGPGLLESTYEKCLIEEFKYHKIKYLAQVDLPVKYKGIYLDCGYRIDLLIEDQLIIELKSVEQINNVHKAQILTYMKLSEIEIGLLINFNEEN